jgi:hypothetical protein
LNRLSLRLEPVTAGQIMVEIAALRTHAADVKRQYRPDGIKHPGSGVRVVGDGQRGGHHDIKIAQRRVSLSPTRG